MEKDEYFQVDKSKEILDINLPVQIGYLILQYAKFRMLQFHWSFWTFTSTADFCLLRDGYGSTCISVLLYILTSIDRMLS